MKKFWMDFLHRGLVTCGLGPIILAILYLIFQRLDTVKMLTVDQVCVGIFSLTALAFIAGGMNAIYQIERLPLMTAIFSHGMVLYVSYLATYLVNDWLEMGIAPMLVFTGIFVVGYLMIWAIIYAILKTRTNQINEALSKKQNAAMDR